MDSQDSNTFSCSQPASNNNIPSQQTNQFTPLNLPFQHVYHFDPTNGTFPSLANQHYGSGFSFQNLLNTPITPPGGTQTHGTTKGPKNKGKESQMCNNSQSSISKKDWTRDQDIALTKAWLHISMDTDVGNNQKNITMWNRISQVWKENMGDECNNVRNNNSLQCRWGKILAAVNKFHGFYERLERHPQSGTNLEDMRMKAMRMYEDLHNGKPFKYIHCWEIMIKNPKWCSKELTKTNVSNRQMPDNSNSPTRDEPSSYLGDDPKAHEGVNSGDVMRPQGRKNCKEKKRKMNDEKSVTDALIKLHCTLEKQVNATLEEMEMKREIDRKEFELWEQVMKKEIELKEKAQKLRERAQRRKEQEHMMNQDLSKLSPIVRASYEIAQAEILKEWENDGMFGNNMDM